MLPSLKVKIGADTKELEDGLSKTQTRLLAFGRIAATAATAAAAATVALTVASLRNIDAIAKQASSLGLTTRELQRMSMVANEAGVETGALSSMLGLMQRNVIELQRGTQRQVETFEALGLSISDLQGLSPEAQFEKIAEALSGIEDPATKTALAMDIFGRSGRAAINMLNNYGDAVDEAAEFQERFGIAVSQTDADQIQRSNDAMERLSAILTGLGNVLATKVAPFLERFANSMIYLAGQVLPDFRGELGSVERAQYELNDAISAFSQENTPEALQSVYDRANAMRVLADEALATARAQLELARSNYELNASDPEAALLLGEQMAQRQRAFNEAAQQLAEAERAIAAAREGGSEFILPPLISDDTTTAITNATAALREMDQVGIEVDDRFKSIASTIDSSMERALMSFVDGTGNMRDSFRAMATEIIKELYRIFVVKRITGFISNMIGGFFNLNQVSGPSMPLGTGNIRPIANPSYAGGGYTGSGPRSGGIDGRGGFPAIMHPNETVVDHSMGQSMGGVVVNQTINVSTGVQQTVRAEIRQLMPQIAESAKSAVVDAKRRGGSYGRAFA